MIAPEMKVVLWTYVGDDSYGGVLVPCYLVLNNAESVLKVTKEDISLATPDLTTGLNLELIYLRRQFEYKLTAWGALRSDKSDL